MKAVYARIQEIRAMYASGRHVAARLAIADLVKRYGKQRDNVGMSVRVAAYHMRTHEQAA